MTGATAPERAGGMMHFRKSTSHLPRMSKDSAKRQGNITQLAFALLGGRDEAIAFLNAVNAELGGRPIDLAVASDQGFAAVERSIRRQAAG